MDRNIRHIARRFLRLGALLLVLFNGPNMLAQDSLRVDSLKIYKGEEVTVEAESIVPRIAREAQPLAIVTRAQIESANAVDLSDAVAFAPGVFVKQYGGLGGLRTVSLRGTSAQQSIILVDGVRYRSSASGAFDLSNIPADMLERVEVVRGGNATLYGANALGGVINLVTHSSRDRPLSITARTARGSHGEERYGANASGAIAGHLWDAGLNATAAEGDYPFIFNEYGKSETVRRENADFSNLYGRLGWTYADGEGLRLSAATHAFRSERGVPGAVVQGSYEQLRARLEEKDLFAVAALSTSWSEWSLALSASGRLNALRYSDPDSPLGGPWGINNYYDGGEGAFMARLRRGIGENGIIEASGEAAYTSLKGDNLDPEADSWVKRLQGSGAASASWFFERGLFGFETLIDGGIRVDYFSDLRPAVSPAIGVVWRLGSLPLRLRAHAALAYRTPSFTEQYYLNTGNRDLRPERAVSYNAGLTYELWESLVVETGFFLIDTRDQIVTVPRSPVSWSAMNIASVRSLGMEIAAAGTLFDGLLGLRSSYTLMRAEDRSGGMMHGRLLVYSPRELFNGILDLRLHERCGLGFSWQYVSHRYALPQNDYASALPHYTTLGANAYATWKIGWIDITTRLEFSNLLDAEYQVVRNYPMPGRMVRGEVMVRYGGEQ